VLPLPWALTRVMTGFFSGLLYGVKGRLIRKNLCLDSAGCLLLGRAGGLLDSGRGRANEG